VPSMSTSRTRSSRGCDGFSLVELLVGLALAALLAAATMPLWVSLQKSGVREADRTIHLLQQRVAVARLEGDLRLASGQGCRFVTTGPILDASGSQVVFLRPAPDESGPIIVEWEIVRGSLMRRWTDCPADRPATYRHSLYADNKTMLEEVGDATVFGYVVNGALRDGPIAPSDLASIEAVVLEQDPGGDTASAPIRMTATARVGR
jgi:prepilin-type N-terminal cleavage/methylation domain-containing protein